MTGRKWKCALTEFQCPLMSIHSQEYNYWCQFFYSSMLFETSKCLYYKFIHIFQIWVMEKMQHVVVQTSELHYPHSPRCVLDFNSDEDCICSGSPQGTILTAHMAHFLHHSKTRWRGTKSQRGMRVSKSPMEFGQRWHAQRQNAKLHSGPSLYLDLVLGPGTPALECVDLESIGSQSNSS